MPFHSDPVLAHILALVILVGRIGDVASTLFVTPKLILETNPIVRRFKWPTMVLGFALCLMPYFDIRFGVMVAVPSLLITSSNLSRGWVSRAIGEREMETFLLRAAARGSLRVVVSMLSVAIGFFLSAAGLLLYISRGPESLEYWVGVGMGAYAVVVGVHGSLFAVRLFHKARHGTQSVDAA